MAIWLMYVGSFSMQFRTMLIIQIKLCRYICLLPIIDLEKLVEQL